MVIKCLFHHMQLNKKNEEIKQNGQTEWRMECLQGLHSLLTLTQYS